MVHTAIALPRDLLDALRRDAIAGGKGLSTAIRHILQMYYLLPGRSAEPETNNLLTSIKTLASVLDRDLGKKWYEHPYALAAFKAGVAAFLARYQPEGDENVPPDWVAGDPVDPPGAVGRTHARRIGLPEDDEGGEPEWEPTDE